MMTDQIYIRDDLCIQNNSAIVSTVQEIYLMQDHVANL